MATVAANDDQRIERRTIHRRYDGASELRAPRSVSHAALTSASWASMLRAGSAGPQKACWAALPAAL